MKNTLHDLRQAVPSHGAKSSQAYFAEILQQNWRIYSVDWYALTPKLIERFMRSHSKTPGLGDRESLAPFPISILFWESPKKEPIKVGVYSNGAVVLKNNAADTLLIDDKTAEIWNYPDEYEKIQ